MIEVRNLYKKYNDVPALDNVSFSVQDGEVIGLLGPNGAGKTTLMKILTGFLQPDAGSARIAGLDVLDQCASIQQLIGYLPENAPLYPELTVQSYLRMIADLRNVPREMQQQKISAAVISTGLTDRLTLPIGTLSKGFRQRVGLAQAILHRPKLLILDEPTNGLDPTQIAEVRHLIKKLARQSTVIISTHILSEVEATCDRAIIIIKGQIKTDARLSELAATSNARLTLETGDGEGPRQILAGLPDVYHVTYDRNEKGRISYLIKAGSNSDLCPAIFALAKEHEWQLCELRQEVRTLEAVFNELATAGGEK